MGEELEVNIARVNGQSFTMNKMKADIMEKLLSMTGWISEDELKGMPDIANDPEFTDFDKQIDKLFSSGAIYKTTINSRRWFLFRAITKDVVELVKEP